MILEAENLMHSFVKHFWDQLVAPYSGVVMCLWASGLHFLTHRGPLCLLTAWEKEV